MSRTSTSTLTFTPDQPINHKRLKIFDTLKLNSIIGEPIREYTFRLKRCIDLSLPNLVSHTRASLFALPKPHHKIRQKIHDDIGTEVCRNFIIDVYWHRISYLYVSYDRRMTDDSHRYTSRVKDAK